MARDSFSCSVISALEKIREMATKKKTNISKKPNASAGQPRSYSELYKSDNVRPVSTVATPVRRVVVAKTPASATSALSWEQEYTYVARDLRMLGIVSAILFGSIMISGFFF